MLKEKQPVLRAKEVVRMLRNLPQFVGIRQLNQLPENTLAQAALLSIITADFIEKRPLAQAVARRSLGENFLVFDGTRAISGPKATREQTVFLAVSLNNTGKEEYQQRLTALQTAYKRSERSKRAAETRKRNREMAAAKVDGVAVAEAIVREAQTMQTSSLIEGPVIQRLNKEPQRNTEPVIVSRSASVRPRTKQNGNGHNGFNDDRKAELILNLPVVVRPSTVQTSTLSNGILGRGSLAPKRGANNDMIEYYDHYSEKYVRRKKTIFEKAEEALVDRISNVIDGVSNKFNGFWRERKRMSLLKQLAAYGRSYENPNSIRTFILEQELAEIEYGYPPASVRFARYLLGQ